MSPIVEREVTRSFKVDNDTFWLMSAGVCRSDDSYRSLWGAPTHLIEPE
jgi:hypothetical protein